MKRFSAILLILLSFCLLLVSCAKDDEPKPQDSDGDGITDDIDTCPDTPTDEAVDLNGCSLSQIDSDEMEFSMI